MIAAALPDMAAGRDCAPGHDSRSLLEPIVGIRREIREIWATI